MVVRKRRRKFKKLGQRTRGHGDTKNMRGSGSRGGKGLAGSHKHKWSKYYKKFGTEKKQILSRKIVKAINIDQLVEMLPKLSAAGIVAKEAGMPAIDGSKIGFDKLLSRGLLSEKIIVRKMKASAKAIEKIKKAGGKFEGETAGSEDEFAEGEEASETEEGEGTGPGEAESGKEESDESAGSEESGEEK